VEQTASAADWILDRELDAFGRLQTPPVGRPNISNADFETVGNYRQGTRIRALDAIGDPKIVTDIAMPNGSTSRTFGETSDSSLMGRLLGFALIALALDALFALMIRSNINAYMAAGGTIVFDTGDEGDRVLRAGEPHPGLKRISEGLDIPRLTEVPGDHVLTKSFYLLQVFPGRWANGPVYVQAAQASSGGRDGVSPVIIGSNDWAAGWAVTNLDGALVDLEKDIPRQREFSIRFGVNIAMYALSGNYKADHGSSFWLCLFLSRPSRQVLGVYEANLRVLQPDYFC